MKMRYNVGFLVFSTFFNDIIMTQIVSYKVNIKEILFIRVNKKRKIKQCFEEFYDMLLCYIHTFSGVHMAYGTKGELAC